MKNNKKHFHVVYSMQYHFELEGAVLFLYAHINCSSYVKVVFKNVGQCWFVGWRAERVCGLVLVNEADLSRVILRYKKGKIVISKNTTR